MIFAIEKKGGKPKMARIRMIKCPQCSDEFELEDYLEIGDTAFCPSCDTELRINRLDPPQVEIASLSNNNEDYAQDDTQSEGQDF
jgi:lysine biosynthesis protein LysW